MDEWDDFIGQNGGARRISCPAEPLREFTPPEFWDKPYDGNPGEDTDYEDGEGDDTGGLESRAGGYGDSRDFHRFLGGVRWDTTSSTYFQGDRLAQHNGDSDRYVMWFDPGDCNNATLRLNDPSNPNPTHGKF